MIIAYILTNVMKI